MDLLIIFVTDKVPQSRENRSEREQISTNSIMNCINVFLYYFF